MALIPGHATPDGTARLAKRHPRAKEHGQFRDLQGLELSAIGLGTYLGDVTAERDRGYQEAIQAAVTGCINVIDSAINYRNQRSERAVGAALREAIEKGDIQRDEVFVSTKGGYIPFDANEADPQSAAQRDYLDTGLVTDQNLAGGMHCMDPRYLADQIRRSRENLGLDTIDLYYVHNPETQLGEVDVETFYNRLGAAFGALERAADAGHLVRYGIATWSGLRVAPDQPGHIALQRVLECARRAAAELGHEEHRFAAVQAPVNLSMPEAILAPTQDLDGETVPLQEATRRLGLGFFASASILQGRLASGIPERVKKAIGPVGTDAQVALQATRSAPGVTTALVGMSRVEHVRAAEDLAQKHAPDPRVWR